MSFLSFLALGFALGMRHATDSDHVIAVTAIVSRERTLRAAAVIGALWGLGHSLTVALAGGAILAFRWVVPPRVGLSLELCVAAMLVGLGVYNLARGAPESGGEAPSRADHREGRMAWGRLTRALRPVAVGVVHGLAGSAAIALLVLTAVRDTSWAALYLAVFGAGTIAGMVLLTLVIAAPALIAARWMSRARSTLVRGTGLASVALGLFLAYRIGVVDGLFSAAPTWAPG